MNLEKLYSIAKNHKDNHAGCGGEPYKSYNKLLDIIKKLNDNNRQLKVLEIGTAVGFTTIILHNNLNQVDTIELHPEHIELAKKNIQNWGGNIGKINFILGDAREILPNLENKYDLIFFDGYGVKASYYEPFKVLLNTSGLLITANRHLKSSEQDYFEKLKLEDFEFIEEFADTVVHRKL